MGRPMRMRERRVIRPGSFVWLCVAAGPICVPASEAVAGKGGCTSFLDPAAFAQHNQEQRRTLIGQEDFEASNLEFGEFALLADPLEGGVANVDAEGLGFPAGLSTSVLTIQSNLVTSNAPQPAPGDGLAALGPGFLEPDPPVPGSVTVGADVFTQSTDLIVGAKAPVLAVGLTVGVVFGGDAQIAVFDPSGELVHQEALAVTGGGPVFFGISCPGGIGRINIGGGGGELIDDVEVWTGSQAPQSCPWDCGDGDGNVGIQDFLALLAQWGAQGSCDFDGDKAVDIDDFLALLANWGPCEAK